MCYSKVMVAAADNSVTQVYRSLSPGSVLQGRTLSLTLGDQLYADPLSVAHKALNNEGKPFLLRFLRPEVVSPVERDKAQKRLASAIGIGGNHLLPMIDLGVFEDHVFAAYELPRGETLAEMMNASSDDLSGDLVPILAQVAAGLRAVPPPWHHGDVSPDQIWIDHSGRAKLSGGFLLAALPPAVWQRFGRASEFFFRVPPEVWRGRCDDSADRFAVAALAHRILFGGWPEERQDGSRRTAHGEVIYRYLGAPDRRPSSLDPLLDALAGYSGVMLQHYSIGPFKRRRRRATQDTDRVRVELKEEQPRSGIERRVTDPHAQTNVAPSPMSEDGMVVTSDSATRVPAPEVAVPLPEIGHEDDREDLTVPRTSLKEIEEAHLAAQEKLAQATLAQAKLNEPAKRRKGDSMDDFDPRFVRAALGVEVEGQDEDELDELDSAELEFDDHVELIEVAAEKDISLNAVNANSSVSKPEALGKSNWSSAPASLSTPAPLSTSAPAASTPAPVERKPDLHPLLVVDDRDQRELTNPRPESAGAAHAVMSEHSGAQASAGFGYASYGTSMDEPFSDIITETEQNLGGGDSSSSFTFEAPPVQSGRYPAQERRPHPTNAVPERRRTRTTITKAEHASAISTDYWLVVGSLALAIAIISGAVVFAIFLK